ncbi:MAG: hypothetical protein HUU55_00955 [Myxococcales bacterium]|nr:hypothetical protein [Myxococcales bacterium]
MNDRRLRPFRVLLHPLWVVSLCLLVVNDHWFKQVYPGWLSGKISDFVGLIVAPWVLCALFGVRRRGTAAGVHVAVGVIFSAINLSTGAAGIMSMVTGWVGFPWSITVDWTDLVGLPMLGVSWIYLLPKATHAEMVTKRSAIRFQYVVSRLTLILGAVACMATSPPDPDVTDAQPFPPVPIQTDAYLFNNTGISRVIRLRPLNDAIRLDCDLIATDPNGLLARSVFGKASVYELFPNSFLPLVRSNNVNECTAYLIDGDGLPVRLLFWTKDDLPVILTDSSAPLGRVELVLEGTDQTALHVDPTSPVDLFFPAPPLEPAPSAQGCAVPSAEQSIVWELPVPLGVHTLTDIQVTSDGCAALTLSQGEGESIQWFVCLPYGMLSLEPGAVVTITSPVVNNLSTVQIDWESGVVKAAIGGSVVPFDGVNTSVTVSEECGWTHDECGSLVRPLVIGVSGAVSGIPTNITDSPVKFEGDTAVLVVTRAFAVAMSGTTCIDPAVDVSEHYFESVISMTKEN